MKYSKNGYKRNSKDKNNPYNVIPSGNITMKGVDFPVLGTDNLGNQKLMMPGANYVFPGNTVFEVPLQNFPRHFQNGKYKKNLPKAQKGKESKKEKKARLEQERLEAIENQKKLNKQIAEDFSTDPVEINTEGLRNPLRVYPNPITSNFMINNPIPTQDTDINYIESMIDYYAGLNDPNSLISQRLRGDFSDNTRFGEYSTTLPRQEGKGSYDIHRYDFEDGDIIKTIDPKRQFAFENLEVTPETVFNAVYPRLTNFTFLDATEKEKIGVQTMKEVDERKEQWIKDGNNPEDFDMFEGLNYYETRALLSKAQDVVGPHVKSLINPYYDELLQGENYEKNKRKLLIEAGEDPDDPRFENLMSAMIMPKDLTTWMQTSIDPDVTEEYLKQDWKDTLAHELGHITGRDDFMSERDNKIYKDLNYAHTHKDEMNEGMKLVLEDYDGHLSKGTTHEASADLNAVRLDMLERGIYDYRNEQMTKEHWDEYLKVYDPDMKTTSENYPLSLQRTLYRYRLDLEENPYRSKLIADPENTGDDQDSNIRFINNSVADANEIGDDIDNSMMAKYGAELPKAQYGKDIIMDMQNTARLNEAGYDTELSDLRQHQGYDGSLENAEMVASIFPVLGEYIDAKNAIKAAYQGRYGDAVLNAAGFLIPFIPGKVLTKGKKSVTNWMNKNAPDVYKYNPWAFGNINSKLPKWMQRNPMREDVWNRQVGHRALVDANKIKKIREIGENISKENYDRLVKNLNKLHRESAGYNLTKNSRYPGPYFMKGELFYDINKKPRKGFENYQFPGSMAKSGDADYLIQTNPKFITDENFHQASGHVMKYTPDPVGDWFLDGSLGIMKPQNRDISNFKFYKKDWLQGYKRINKLPNKKIGGSLLKAEEGDELSINFDELEKGIKYAESLNGELMKNPDSSASGFYGQLFSEIKNTYDGTRDDFIKDVDYQLELFKKRANGEMENIPGLIDNGIEIYKEYENQINLNEHGLSPLTIAGLSNMLGRQGTREYIGYVLRDGKPIEEVFPHLYGEDVEAPNHSPTEYVQKFNKGLLIKKEGGAFDKKIKRLNQQFELYKNGKEISPIAERELIALNMIKPRMQAGGSYTIKSGDRLGRIARDNNITLEELLKINTQFKNPSQIYPGQKVYFSKEQKDDDSVAKPQLKHVIKKGETLSGIANIYGLDYNQLAELNGIKNPSRIRTGNVINIPPSINIDRDNPKIIEQERIAMSPFNEEEVIILNDDGIANQSWVKREFINGKWVNVEGKRNNIKNINLKEDQSERIVSGINDNFTGTYKEKIYKIKKGDYLGKIAKEHGISLSKLMSDNNISNENKDNINIGQEIKIIKSDSEPYLILDDSKGRLHVYYPGENDPRYSYPVLTGAMSGDQQTETQIAFFKDGEKLSTNQINEAVKKFNLTNVNQLLELPGYTSEVDWEMGNKVTGAGIYEIDLIREDGGYYDETGQGRSIPSFTFTNESGISVPMVIHGGTYNRKDILQSIEDPNTDRSLTNGCINGRCSDLNELYTLPGIGKGTKMYVLPEEKGNNFIYENGKINFYSSRENQRIANEGYTTESGEYVEGGPGINVTQSFDNYKPINITFDKNYYQNNSNRYDGTAKQEELEFAQNTTPFLNAIVDNKKMMMEKLNIDGDLYNDLALITFGIYGYESGMGDINSSSENASKFGYKAGSKAYNALSNLSNEYLGLDIGRVKSQTSPDVQSKYTTYGQRDENNSVGWTQIRWSERDESELEALRKIGITDPEQLMDPKNAALATIAILHKQYQNQIYSKDKVKSDFDIFTELPKKYSPTGGEGYADMVNQYMSYIDLSETDIDDLDNNLIIKGEYNTDGRDLGTKTADLIDSGIETLTGSELTEQSAVGDLFDYLSNTTSEEKIDDLKEWWNNVDLNPFWKLGGEFGLRNQNQFYNDYINGVYKNTKQEKNANKLFDKINRMYYNDSKKSGMHQLDVLRKAIGSQSVKK
jgi:LysM repeat protein